MKKYLSILALTTLCTGLVQAQMDGPGLSPAMSAAMSKAFGTNLNFSATMRSEVKMIPQNQSVTMTGKMYFSNRESCSELDMTKMTGSAIPPEAITQMKSMGMDKVVSISQNSQKALLVIY